MATLRALSRSRVGVGGACGDKKESRAIARWIKRPIWSVNDWGRALGSRTSGARVLGGQELSLGQVKVTMIGRLKNKFSK